MPQVPYKPFPTVEPASQPTPKLGLNVPGAAFGENIAQATKGFGGALQQASDDASKTALQIAALQNDTWAKDADTEAMVKIGQADSEFKQLEGQAAVAALPEHQKRIQDIRDDALSDAPNAAAKRMLNNTITRRVGFAVVDAGNYAGTQAKVALNNASSARLQAAQETVDISSESGRRQGEKTISAEVRHQSDVHGAEPETHEENVHKAISKMYVNGLRKMAPADPEGAEKVFNDVKDRLDPQDRDVLQNVVNQNMALKGSAIIASRVMKDYDPSKGKGDLEEFLKRGQDATKDSANPFLQERVESRIRTMYGIGQSGFNDTQAKNLETVTSYIHGKDWSNAVTSLDGIVGPKAPPEIRSAFDSLNVKGQQAVINALKHAGKLDIPYGREQQIRFGELKDLADQKPDQFRQLTLIDESLPRGKIDQLRDMQRKVNNRQDPNSEINKYLNNAKIRSTLNAAEVVSSKTDQAKADTYNHFVGAFQQQIDQFKEEHDGKGPDQKGLEKLTQDLLHEIVTGPGYGSMSGKIGSGFWAPHSRRFETAVPEEFSTAIKESFRKQHGREASEDEVRASYIRDQKFPEVQ